MGELRPLAALVAATALACSDPGESEALGVPAAMVRAPDAWNTEWELQVPSATLRFLEGPLDPPATREVKASCLPIDGGLLVNHKIWKAFDYEMVSCFLELQPDGTGWRPRAAGLYFTSCTYLGWLPLLEGTVQVATRQDGTIDCRVDLGCRPEAEGELREYYDGDFWLDPRSDSLELRNELAEFGWRPSSTGAR